MSQGMRFRGTPVDTDLSSRVLMRVSAQRIGNWPTSLSPVGPSLVILPQMGSLGYEDDQPGGGFELGTVVHSCNLSTKEDDAGGHL